MEEMEKMSKSKKERQQEKREQRQAQVQTKKSVEENKKTEEAPVIKNSQPDASADVKMNFYSGMSMITTIMAAASAVVAMLVASRGFYYILQTLYDETKTDIVLLSDNLVAADFSPSIRIFLYVMGLLMAVQVILSLVGTVTAINPKKKPLFPISVAMTVLAVATLVLYLVGHAKTGDISNMFSRVEVHKQVGLYTIYLYVLIANLVCAVVNLFGQMYGLKLYKKTGSTC